MKPRIIFNDKYLLVLDKPPGWIVNEASSNSGKKNVIQTWLKLNFDYQIAKEKKFRSGIVHRLDKDTSGILIIAKTPFSFENLQNQFKKRLVKKTYIALVHNKLEIKNGEINVPVGRLPWNRERFGVLAGGRESKTLYKVISYFSRNSDIYTLTEFYPETGRTHQIRIHAKYLGYPIVSDDFYSGRKTANEDKKFCPRLFLHSSKIEFYHPDQKIPIKLESGIPADLRKALSNLKKLDEV